MRDAHTRDTRHLSDAELESAPRILCIDEDPQVCEAIAKRLAPYDVEIHTTFLGTLEYWMANEELPDLIITDYRMPRGNAALIVETVRRNQKTWNIPVIVLSRQVDHARCDLHQYAVQEIIAKPVDLEKLINIISKYIPLEMIRNVQGGAERGA